MATETRKDKLLEFYSECQKNGYTDMKDKTQSLKAKVIASDLGLNYSKIGALYDEAKKVSEEKKQLDSKEGKLVYSCFSSSYNYEKESPILELYICGDNSYFCVVGEKRINGTPTIFTETVVLPKIYIRAPSTTYYGVAYNGMATGTVSHDPGGETMRMEKTEGANVVFQMGEDKYAVKAVKPSPQAYAAFKRDEAFRQFYNGKVLVLDNMNQVTYSGDIYASMRQIVLPADEAQKAADLLRRMGSDQLPPTDQELYDKALGLISAKSSAEVQKAIDTFDLISDYKDSSMQKDKAEKRLAEVIQIEKEAAIIGKERSKRVAIISTILSIIALIVAFTLWAIPTSKVAHQRANTISNNIVGKSFTNIETVNNGYYSSSDFGYRLTITETYNFSANKVNEQINTRTEYNTSYARYRYVNERLYSTASEEKSNSHHQYDYTVKVSIFGGVRVNFNHKDYKLSVDDNDVPVSMTDGKKTYK